jgi:hypothetical protein
MQARCDSSYPGPLPDVFPDRRFTKFSRVTFKSTRGLFCRSPRSRAVDGPRVFFRAQAWLRQQGGSPGRPILHAPRDLRRGECHGARVPATPARTSGFRTRCVSRWPVQSAEALRSLPQLKSASEPPPQRGSLPAVRWATRPPSYGAEDKATRSFAAAANPPRTSPGASTSGNGRRPCWPAPCGRCRPCA